ncbi:hypothetical protein [Methylobacterium oxalidis]|uniref:Uncharacterized protein n=1 Tax=Methylobacterium oxalidis TaxID=944322 RepID=A0A512IX59_9HYPH|nr:hypothetical protein [Methylobacterium oxalidis]GEP02307.1 hypothetical protein MOX02_03450 [Methylobacterium oxalidis]GJE31185.1 hypothetical protein LDDCCGHA_1361 [Methylobacterium oxalidis]GLS67686.1 hypothetical protein GCM10007888_60710 [Methylobacterium oxalidis]
MTDFDHILNWTLKRGSHPFPGPDGGTCINEAALVACGFPYQSVRSPNEMPLCFSRPICRLALHLNDEASDAERLRLIPFVTRLACADTPEIEEERAAYIRARINLDSFYLPHVSLTDGIRVLEGALAIGRQADLLALDDVAARLDAARAKTAPAASKRASVSQKLKAWLGVSEKEPSAA